ncbi:MAG: TonB family protein [Rhizobacter sp.]
MPARAQPAPAGAASAPAAEMTAAERAQRDADKVFKWILIHSDKPRKAGATRPEEKREETKPVVAARAKPAVHSAEPTQGAVAATPATSATPAATATPAPTETNAASVASLPAPAPGAVPAVALPVASPPAAATETAVAALAVDTRGARAGSPAPAAVAAEALDEQLTPLFRADPQFPPNLLRTLRKGQVQVRFTVQPDGSVVEPAVVSTSNAKLNASALAAVAQWRFAPLHRPQAGMVALGFDID